MAATALAQTEPSQSPLLSVATTGAKPNLMLVVDNSLSMAFPYPPITYRVSSNGLTASQKFGWFAQRSAQVNPLYYDPRITYLPRVDHLGKPLVPADGITFVSNQVSGPFQYRLMSYNILGSAVQTYHSSYEINPVDNLTQGWSVNSWVEGGTDASYQDIKIPRHLPHNTTSPTTPAFTYVTCTGVIPVDSIYKTGCSAYTRTDIRPGSPAIVPLPADHRRTDCSDNACTNAQEIANILNWYRYYLFAAPAVATAIGQALASPEFDGRLRIGYTRPTKRGGEGVDFRVIADNDNIPGVTTDLPRQLRGVRTHRLGSLDTKFLYAWLYDQDGTRNPHSTDVYPGLSELTYKGKQYRTDGPMGSSINLPYALNRVSEYLRVSSPKAKENPWARNPAAREGATNPEHTCRRSFTLLLANGGWSGVTTTSSNFDNANGPTFTGPGGATFGYRPRGIDTSEGRHLYTPYPGPKATGLADLTARYHWHMDLRPINNEVPPRAGNPSFWQNMTTYTVGFGIQPGGDVSGATSGLTLAQIKQYQAQYPQLGYAAATKPKWTEIGDVSKSHAYFSRQDRIDDFFQAGFTGGGMGLSASNAEDLRQVLRTIFSDVAGGSARDAGVAVRAGADSASIAGDIKYTVTYKTADNIGDVTAHDLDAQGNTTTRWRASDRMPAPAARRIFAMSGQNSPIDFTGHFSALSADIRASLQTGPDAHRVPTDERFVNYLRGLDPVLDADGRVFRPRVGKMGSMVNPPALYMGADTDLAYDLAGSGAVTGSAQYLAYVQQKATLPAALMVATNAGQVHAIDAASGDELAVFMPRRSMARLLDYARENQPFRYILDGPISEHDIHDGTRWNHLAVGTGGRGERVVYALRSPLNDAAATPNRQPSRLDFLWETGPDLVEGNDLAMGHITTPARSGQTRSGHWVVLLTSGHHNGHSDGSRHGLIALDAMTGDLIRRIPLPTGYSAGRGMGGLTLVRDNDKRVVAAYAGDAKGQLWRFDLLGKPNQWKVSYGQPLFAEPNQRPIYGAPAWQASSRHGTGTVVVFATGLLIDEADRGDTTSTESIYGIWDPTPVGTADAADFSPRLPNQLVEQSVNARTAAAGQGGNTFYTTSRSAYDPKSARGWRLPLNREGGERSFDLVRNLGANVLVATTVMPPPAADAPEQCTASTTNYLYVLDAQTGAQPAAAFDQNGDGRLDAYAVVKVPTGGYTRNLAVREVGKRERWSTQRRQLDNTQADEGEGSTRTNCSNITARLIGTESGSLTAGATCPKTRGWSATHYTIMRPPQ